MRPGDNFPAMSFLHNQQQTVEILQEKGYYVRNQS
jgi:hypothetical protein